MPSPAYTIKPRRAGPGYGEDLTTERGYYRFTVKQDAHRQFWIAAEPADATIESLDDWVLGFHLGPQAPNGDAVRVVDFLNRNILAITLS